MNWRVLHGDCRERLAEIPAGSVDAVVTDPPYGIGFMGHEWDQPGVEASRGPARYRDKRTGGSMEAGKYDLSAAANRKFQIWCEAWASECLRVLKPGGHMVSFGGTRTYHRMAAGVEDAGFEIRDQLAWLFGSGFPKNRALGDGRGTGLKPAHEPILLARKPMPGSARANVERHGTGGLNIDACRIGSGERPYRGGGGLFGSQQPIEGTTDKGRFPANVVLDRDAGEVLDDQSGELVPGANPTRRSSDKFRDVYGDFGGQEECNPARGADRGGASRFYYCAKTSRAERSAGLGDEFAAALDWSSGDQAPGTFQSEGTDRTARNPHPTVKPIDLLRWLCRLITPVGGLILDPFTGSGTTGIAALLEGFDFVGIEREPSKPGKPNYVSLAKARIAFWAEHGEAALDAMYELERAARAANDLHDMGQIALDLEEVA